MHGSCCGGESMSVLIGVSIIVTRVSSKASAPFWTVAGKDSGDIKHLLS